MISVERIQPENPVWVVYDCFKSTMKKVKYYQWNLSYLIAINIGLEYLLAISVSSCIAGLSIWQISWAGIIWKCFGIMTALLSILKPHLNLTEKIQEKKESFERYKYLENDLENIVIMIRNSLKYNTELQNTFNTSLKIKKESILSPPKIISKAGKEKYIEIDIEIESEFPDSSFFIPEE